MINIMKKYEIEIKEFEKRIEVNKLISKIYIHEKEEVDGEIS